MSRIEESIEVNVPVHTAYNQWTQFEDFPRFMEGVEEVHQLDDTTLRWRANIAGRTKEWRAKIVEQQPDRRIAWQSTEGAPNNGTVWFEASGGDRTRVHLELEAEPEGPIESAGDALGFLDRRVKGDLDRFKEFIESRSTETGAWRGEVEGGRETSGARSGTRTSSGAMGTGAGTVGSGTDDASRPGYGGASRSSTGTSGTSGTTGGTEYGGTTGAGSTGQGTIGSTGSTGYGGAGLEDDDLRDERRSGR